MTSSMSTGERRWASARRGGMTVLGKVAVPKPLNLPSQRLENHGLDPTVEIVPKGTLSWGSRSSSSASNAWGSSTLSPNADGGNSSPSHLSGRPSSGSGTRPSTAGSDRTREPTPTAWGQNSRPSSASGALTSSQTTLTSLRPRSAETRPGSSQLSRFAESPSDSSIAWGPTGGASEKLGVVASSKNDGFALSSGDFPTLGSERDNSGKNIESKDLGSYGVPDSSSGRAAPGKEKSSTPSIGDVSVNANVKSFSGNTWRRDGSQHVEDGVQHAVEKWQGDPPHYLNANVPPQHFEAWHGPPINPPPGVWYRGPPGGPPYGTPLGPGGFPIEPFPYYRPQIPPPALTNSQPVPPSGPGPRGPHPKNGDMYRPHIPDAYIRPGMPIRPGFFPGPMAFDGYYGPPMGYCNANERDIPFMGMAASPSVYNRYSCDNGPDPGNNHARAGPHGSTGKTFVSEQVESGHPDGSHGTYKVILKQHSEWDEKQEEGKWEDAVPAGARYPGKREPPRASPKKTEWGLEDRKDEEIYSGRRTRGGDACSRNFVNQGSSSDTVKVKLPENGGKAKAVDDGLVRKSENAALSFPQPAQVAPATSKDPTLIQKIECLNAKARASDGRPDSASNLSGEELKGSSQVDAKANYLMNEAGTRSVNFERTHTSGNIIPASHEVDVSAEDKTLHPAASSGVAGSRRTSQLMQGRLDHDGKRFNTQDADGWPKKPSAESVNANSAARSEPSANIHLEEHFPSAEAAEKYGIDLQGKDGGEFLTPVFDSSDCQVQRAKMREIAKQRARQLQKEEEERTREQKAKALAKLEELNRRTQSIDGPTQKFEKVPPSCPIQLEQEECQIPAEQVMVVSKSETLSSALVSIPNTQIRESSNIESAVPTRSTSLEISNNVQHEPSVPHGQSLPLQQDAHTASVAKSKGASLDNEDSVSMHKRVGYKQKQNSSSLGTNSTQRSVPVSPTEAPKAHSDVAASYVASTEVADEVGWSCESSLPMSSNAMAESSAHLRRKNSRSSKNKHKLDDVPTIAAAPSALLKETNAEKFSTERGKTRTSELEIDPSSVQSKADAKQTIHPSEEHSSLSIEDASGRVNSQLKSQHTRRMPRNQQANRMADKFHSSDNFVWAPVRSQSKAEVTDEASDKMMPDTANETSKSDNLVHNNLKSKRAEMERYVPKPVAKELAQQGSTQQSVVSSVNHISLDGTVGRSEPSQNIDSCLPGNSAIGIVGSTVESWNGDGKQNKQSKAHGSWRQRGSVESGFQDGASSRNPSKSILKSLEQHQSSRPDVHSMKEQTKSSDDCNTSDGWNTAENSDTAAPVVKDQVVTSRGKRHPFKGHRSMGNNDDYDQRNVSSGDTGKSSFQTPAPEMGQIEKGIASKESRGFGERTSSHWQPKSQLSSDHNQRGSRPGGGQNVTAEVTNAVKKESLSKDRVHPPPHHNKEHREHVPQPPTDESLSEQKNMAGVPTFGHQESKRERKVASFRGRPHSPNQSSVNMIEPAPPASLDPQNEQRFSSFRKNGNQNNRSGRGYESRGDWSSAGPDDRQHNTSSNRERQRHNSHYEYQPIGQYNNNKSNNSEGTTSGSNNRGSRHRERNQGHSRRGGGNFSGQQSGTVHVDANYDE